MLFTREGWERGLQRATYKQEAHSVYAGARVRGVLAHVDLYAVNKA